MFHGDFGLPAYELLHSNPPGVNRAVIRTIRIGQFDEGLDAQAESRPEDVQFARDVLDGKRDLGEDIRQPLDRKYRMWGEAAAYIVDLVVRETPPQPPNLRSRVTSIGSRVMSLLGRQPKFEWPAGMFAVPASEAADPEPAVPHVPLALADEITALDKFFGAKDPQVPSKKPTEATADDAEMSAVDLAEVGARVFCNARERKNRESIMPYLSKIVGYEGILEMPSGYSELLWDMTPAMFVRRRLRKAYREGFEAAARELGLGNLTVAHGKEIMRRAPKYFRMLPIKEADKYVDVLTEYGLYFRLERLSDGTIVRLPTTPASVWARTRAQQAKPVSARQSRRAHEAVVTQIEDKVREGSNGLARGPQS